MPRPKLSLIPCPKCGHLETSTIDIRPVEIGWRRRKQCPRCDHTFTTIEVDALEFQCLVRAIDKYNKIFEMLLTKSGVTFKDSQRLTEKYRKLKLWAEGEA